MLDETHSVVDRSVSKRMAQLCDNNQVLSSDFSYATFHRPLIDLLSNKQRVSGSASPPMDRGISGAGAGKRPRSASGQSGDGTQSGEDMHILSLGYGEDDPGTEVRTLLRGFQYIYSQLHLFFVFVGL